MDPNGDDAAIVPQERTSPRAANRSLRERSPVRCAQCLQPHRDPATGKVSYVFSCFNQDQPLDRVDFPALDLRLRQNAVQEKLTAQWIGHALTASR
jgi:hypothetical protein